MKHEKLWSMGVIVIAVIVVIVIVATAVNKNNSRVDVQSANVIETDADQGLLSLPDFFAKYSQTKNAVIVDVRTPAEFNQGHIENAVNIDIDGPAFESKVKNLDPKAVYLLYCRSGYRSNNASMVMKDLGLQVYQLKGGLASNSGAIKLVR